MSALPDDPDSGSPRDLLDRVEAERRGTPFLVFRDNERQHLVDLQSVPSPLSIGRRPDRDVALPWDGEASRLHAELECGDGGWSVVDEGRSRNGTFVNGERVLGRRRLSDRDVLEIGRTQIVFRSPVPGSTAGGAEVSTDEKRVLVALCRPLASSSSFASPASNRQIAHELVISTDAVKDHLLALSGAFRIGDVPEDRAALAREAIARGIVTRRDLE